MEDKLLTDYGIVDKVHFTKKSMTCKLVPKEKILRFQIQFTYIIQV